MTDLKLQVPPLSPTQRKALLTAVSAVLVLAALWFAWSGWQQQQDEARRASLQRARDAAAQTITATLAQERARMVERLASGPVQAALAAGDLTAAGNRLTAQWPDASAGTVFPPDLERVYAALPSGSYGRLAVLEAALLTNEPVTWVVSAGNQRELALAAPARAGEQLVGVALVRLPLEHVLTPLNAASLADGGYLALRQGGYSVLERGNTALATGAEALATPVAGSNFRIVAAVPDVEAAPFGLTAMACFIVAGVLVLVALLVWRLPALLARRAPRGEAAEAAPEQELPLQALVDSGALARPASDKPKPSPTAAAEAPIEPSTSTATTTAGVAIDRGIFRAYDIRGVLGKTLDAGVAELIGHAIGSLMHDKGLSDIVVGRDGRLSGPELAGGLIRGLRMAGRNVIDIGLAPTPLVYFGAYHLHAGSCVSVTGSHNPPDYNGFKIVVGGETLYGDAILDLYARIAEDHLHNGPEGRLEQRDINEDYVQRIASDVQIDRPLKVVVDAGNGVAGELGPRVLAAIGADVTPLYCEIDGSFPNHHPDPSDPQNLADLIQMVQRLDADLGIAFDGDGDRLGVVTRDGSNVFPDRLLMLFAADVLDRNPGAMIIYDVKCTGRLPGHILRHGGSPLMWKTGHSLIKAKMRETDAELAGEMSGHFFFKERWYGFDDGIYAAARLLEILAARPETAGETLAALPDGIATAEIKIEAPGGNPHAFVERFVEQAKFEGARLSTIDGLRVDWSDGWGLVRASNTTPVLVLRFDADSNEAMARIKQAFREQLLALQPDLALPF